MSEHASGLSSVIAMPRSLSGAMALLLLLGTTLKIAHADGSFQSGRSNGAVYAGGMDYTDEKLYVTGITYQTNSAVHSKEAQCFASTFQNLLVSEETEAVTTVWGHGKYMHSCHAIQVLHDKNFDASFGDKHPFLITGTSEAPRKSSPDEKAPKGVLLTLDHYGDVFKKHHEIDIDSRGETDAVSYPISSLHVYGQDRDGNGDPNNEQDDQIFFVASLSSKNLDENPGNAELMSGSDDQPNWMKYYKYGSSFELSVQKYVKSKISTKTPELEWASLFPVDTDEDRQIKSDVYVGGMIIKRRKWTDLLIVAGSTSAAGKAYGERKPGTTDQDGFITVISGHTGKLHSLNLNKHPKHKNTRSVGTAEIDLILGICDGPGDYFYVVGSTGDHSGIGDVIDSDKLHHHAHEGSLHGFVQKIDAFTLETEWSKTWAASFGPEKKRSSVTAGVSCYGLDDGSVYVAGIVEDGAQVVQKANHEVYGDDIVAMRLDKDGELIWVEQIGSEDGHENLARGGAAAVDHYENLVLLGDTTGSFQRKREGPEDKLSNMFVATFWKPDGNHDKTVRLGEDHKKDHKEENLGMISGGKWKEEEVNGESIDFFSYDAIGIQSGPSRGDVYAGGMVYDSDADKVYLTGIAYEKKSDLPQTHVQPSCMVTKVSVDKKRGFSGWAGADGSVIGQSIVMEICNSIALHGYDEVVVVGNADKGSDLQRNNAKNHRMAGFALALDKVDLDEADVTGLIREQADFNIEYPIEILSDGDDMYIISLTSVDNQVSPEYTKMHSFDEKDLVELYAPNWINMRSHGKSFYMTVTKVTLKEQKVDGVSVDKIAFNMEWTKDFPVNEEDGIGIPRVYLGGAILKKSYGYLAVSGSTRGMGKGYGAATGSDEDGFVALIDTDSGELSDSINKDNVRVGTAEDDFVLGMCHDPNDDSSFYVVGGTMGRLKKAENITETNPGSTHAFILKLNAGNLSTIWAVQIGARHNDDGENTKSTAAKAFDCVVRGDSVYFGGIVDADAGVVFNNIARNSRGGDDVWLSSARVDNGQLNWVTQFGSSKNDHMAPRGGLIMKNDGNLMVFGDTTGEFFRQHISENHKVSELFLMEVQASNGAHKFHVKHHESKPQPNLTPAQAPSNGNSPPAPTPGSDVDVTSVYIPIGNTETTAPPFLVDSSMHESVSSRGLIAVWVVCSLLIVIGCIVLVYCCRERLCARRQKNLDGVDNEEKDGVISLDRNTRTPPPSSFRDAREHSDAEGYSDDMDDDGYSDDLKIKGNEII